MLLAVTFEKIKRSLNPLSGKAEIDRRRNLENLRAACLCIALIIRFANLPKLRHLNLGCELNFLINFFPLMFQFIVIVLDV
jgi:hypothetical protein